MSKRKSLLSKEAKRAIANARQAKKNANKLYRDKAKEMRAYLKNLKSYDLRKQLSTGQKSYINKAWNEYQELKKRPHKIIRTKNKKKLKALQSFGNNNSKVKFDVAFVPTSTRNVNFEYKNDKVIMRSKYVHEESIPFNLKNLAIDPYKEIQRVIDANPEYSNFVLEANHFLFNGPVARSLAAERFGNHLMRYAPGGDVYEDAKHKNHGPNHDYRNWAFGIRGSRAKNQAGINEYYKAYHKANAEKKEERKRKKRRERYLIERAEELKRRKRR